MTTDAVAQGDRGPNGHSVALEVADITLRYLERSTKSFVLQAEALNRRFTKRAVTWTRYEGEDLGLFLIIHYYLGLQQCLHCTPRS